MQNVDRTGRKRPSASAPTRSGSAKAAPQGREADHWSQARWELMGGGRHGDADPQPAAPLTPAAAAGAEGPARRPPPAGHRPPRSRARRRPPPRRPVPRPARPRRRPGRSGDRTSKARASARTTAAKAAPKKAWAQSRKRPEGLIRHRCLGPGAPFKRAAAGQGRRRCASPLSPAGRARVASSDIGGGDRRCG